jgi:hypothetical protein
MVYEEYDRFPGTPKSTVGVSGRIREPKRRAAALLITVEKLARLLNLRDGIEIVSAHYDPAIECLELFLAEPGCINFPAKEKGAQIIRVPLRDLVDLD